MAGLTGLRWNTIEDTILQWKEVFEGFNIDVCT